MSARDAERAERIRRAGRALAEAVARINSEGATDEVERPAAA